MKWHTYGMSVWGVREKKRQEREREREEGGDNVTLWKLHKEGYIEK